MFLALATNTHSSNGTNHAVICGHHPDANRGQKHGPDREVAGEPCVLGGDGADIRRQVVWQVVFALGFTVVVIVLWARFALGSIKLDGPLDLLQLSRGRIIWTRLISTGFLVSGLAPNLVSTSSPIRLFIDPLPLGVLFCVPGLVAIRRLRAHLETQGNPAKPAMGWLDRGVLAGWSALCLGFLWWALFYLPSRLPL